LNSQLKLTSANSINIARLIPQSFYYFSSFAQLQSLGKPIVYAVPSGNFGNLTGGVLAQKMGLPITSFHRSYQYQ
jgi:threonine synthase